MELHNFPALLDLAFTEWRVKQARKRGAKTSIDMFAEYLGFSRPIVNLWLNGDRTPSKGNVQLMLPKLVELVGNQVYDVLHMPAPDPDLESIYKLWDFLPENVRHELAEQAEKYATKNEISPKTNPIRKTS